MPPRTPKTITLIASPMEATDYLNMIGDILQNEEADRSPSPEELCEATFDTIPIGHKNAISPNKDIVSMFQDYVDARNTKGDVVITTEDGKYFRPFPFDATDNKMFEDYIESEFDKADSIIEKCVAMQDTYHAITDSISQKWKECLSNA